LTSVNFITEDKMLCYTYLNENRMFTNKLDTALFGKENAWEAGGVRERFWQYSKFNLHT